MADSFLFSPQRRKAKTTEGSEGEEKNICTMDKSTFRGISGAFLEKIHWGNPNNIQTHNQMEALWRLNLPELGMIWNIPKGSHMGGRFLVTIATFSAHLRASERFHVI